jgi:hypothetical protein
MEETSFEQVRKQLSKLGMVLQTEEKSYSKIKRQNSSSNNRSNDNSGGNSRSRSSEVWN